MTSNVQLLIVYRRPGVAGFEIIPRGAHRRHTVREVTWEQNRLKDRDI